MIGGGYVVERQGVSFRNGRVTKTQMIAGDKDPAPCAMETCLAPAARAGHIEGVIASAVTPTRKGEANDWLVRKFPLIGQENGRSEEHTSELQSLMRTSYAVFCLKKKNISQTT